MLNHTKDKIIQEVQKNGISECQEFLNKEQFEDLKKILINNKNAKGTKNSFFYRSKGNFLLRKLFNFELTNFLDCLKLMNLSKDLKLNQLSSEICGRKTKLVSIDSYFSEVSSSKVLDWHVDQGYSGNLKPKQFLNPDHCALKYFIYLTDVSSNNGCLGYIPGSHKILYFLKLGILNDKIKYKPYWKLNDLRNIVQDNYYRNYLETKIKKELIDSFLEQSSFIINSPHDTQKYDFALKKNSALIFDEGGVHRGAETLKTSRLIVRFIYKDVRAPD
jgi:ectoine hydroxylase-related dioxygenase (phytanoyl-CoA dioxygenase family)